MAKNKTLKERMAVQETKMDELIKGFTNHLEHHKKLFYIVLASLISTGFTLGVALIKLL